MPKLVIERITLTHLSLTLVGLMWVFPFLHYRHQYPLTTFDQEWWSALLGIMALVLLLGRDESRQAPRVMQLPAALIGLVWLQYGLGMLPYAGQALLYSLYLLFGTLLVLLGGRLRDDLGLDAFATVLAVFLLTGAECGALIGMLQHFHWHTLLDAVVVGKVSLSVYGNLAQPNHFANYTALGLISLGLLFQLRRLQAVWVILLAIPLLYVMMYSGSRSSWLYLLMMIGLSWWSAKRLTQLRPLLYYCLWLLMGYVLLHGLAQLPFMAKMNGVGAVNTLQRMAGEDATGGIRLYLWHEAWLIFKQFPWLGAGFGQFGWQHVLLGPELHRTNIGGLFNNAHNLIFQLAAETGVAGLAILFVGVAVWLHGLRRATMSAAHWWCYALLGVLGIHSLLEYPLWYAYFLAIAAILLGALDETHYRFELRSAGRLLMAAILVLGLAAMIQLRTGYSQLKEALAVPRQNTVAMMEHKRAILAAMHDNPVLSSYADYFLSSYVQINDDRLDAKRALNSRAMHFIPSAQVVYRQAFLLAQSGQELQAEQIFKQAFWSYPSDAGAKQELVKLADKDPAHFSSLLKFAFRTEQEYAIAIHNK